MNWWKQAQIAQLIDHYQNLSEREQTLTQLTLHMLIFALLILLLVEPIFSDAQNIHSQTGTLKSENRSLEQQLFSLQNEIVIDPNQALRDQLEQLQAEHKNIQLRINNLTDALVSPDNMISVLEQMLTQDQRLKITRLETIPKQPIQLDSREETTHLFRHGLRVTVNATYQGLVAYLKRLDALKWRLYWQMLDYKVTRYPKGELTLEVYTLSTREEVLGA